MTRLFPILVLLLSSIRGVLTQNITLIEAVELLPSCALPCLESAILNNSTCAVTNTTCICGSAPLLAQATLCIEASCTIREELATKNITDNLCGDPVREQGIDINALAITLFCISTVIMVLREWSKVIVGKAKFGIHDCQIVGLWLTGLASTMIIVLGLSPNGFGKDIWTQTPHQISVFLKYFYVIELLYFTQVCQLKLCILWLYFRVFPTTAKTFRKLLWITIIFTIIFGIAFTIVGIFQCRPVSYFWHQWDGEHKGTCINDNALAWANAIVSILLDFWMIGLPISQLVSLKMHWKKKVGVGLMFVVGTFVTLVSILRLQSLVAFAKSQNVTWGLVGTITWSVVEINVGSWCACMTAMRVFYTQLFPSGFPKIPRSTNQSADQQEAKSWFKGHNRLGTDLSVDRGKDLLPLPKDKSTNSLYNVDLEDNTRLVPMSDVRKA